MELTGAQAVCESLVREGVETVFGIPGGGAIFLYDAVPEFPIHHVLVRHEQAAAHAADGYARATGRVGVCFATSGPGATNLITGLATALRDSTPVVAITGQASFPVLGTDAFQEVDITSITAPVTKHNYLVSDSRELPRVMREAFHIARTGRPGPVLVSVTADAQTMSIEYVYPDDISLPGYRPAERPSDDSPLGEDTVQKVGREHRDEPIQWDTGAQESDDSIAHTIAHQIDRVAKGCALIISDLGPTRALEGSPPFCDWQRGVNLSGGPKTPGSALPAAIGAQVGLPDELVWVIAGYPSFQTRIQELVTVVQERLPIKIAIVTSGCSSMRPLSGRTRDGATGKLGPDLVQVVGAYGIPGVMVKEEADIELVIAEAIAFEGASMALFDIAAVST